MHSLIRDGRRCPYRLALLFEDYPHGEEQVFEECYVCLGWYLVWLYPILFIQCLHQHPLLNFGCHLALIPLIVCLVLTGFCTVDSGIVTVEGYLADGTDFTGHLLDDVQLDGTELVIEYHVRPRSGRPA